MNDLILGPQAPLDDTWFTKTQLAMAKALGESCPVVPPTSADPAALDRYIVGLYYYDLGKSEYIVAERTKDPYFLTLGDKCVDSWWQHPAIDQGRNRTTWPAPRNAAVGGLMLRALRGKSQYWDWTERYLQAMNYTWLKARINNPMLHYGVREGAFTLQGMTWLSQVLPDTFPLQSGGTATNGAAIRAQLLADVEKISTDYYGRLQLPDGSWRWDDVDVKDADGGYLKGITQPFQIGLLLLALADVHKVTQNATVKENIKNQILKGCRHLYSDGPYRKDDPTPYDPLKKWRCFWYLYHGGTTVNPTKFEKGGWSLAGINADEVADARQSIGPVVGAYGYAYLISGDPFFKAAGGELWDAAYSGTDGIRNLMNTDGKGFNQNCSRAGSYPAWLIQAGAQPAPQPVPTPAFTPSPDGTEGPVITDSTGALWTLRDTKTLRNGTDVGGAGLVYLYWQNVVYVQGMSSAWFRWTGTEWKFESATRPPAPVLVTQQPPTPTPTPVPVDPAPNPTPTEPQYEFKKFRWPTDDAGQDAVEKQAAVEGWTDCYVAGNWFRCKRLRQ